MNPDLPSHGVALVVVPILAGDVRGSDLPACQVGTQHDWPLAFLAAILRSARSLKSQLVVKYPIISCLESIWQHRCP